jgi:hypothetical protein
VNDKSRSEVKKIRREFTFLIGTDLYPNSWRLLEIHGGGHRRSETPYDQTLIPKENSNIKVSFSFFRGFDPFETVQATGVEDCQQ